MTTKAIIGSRESQLAVLQSEMVKAYIEQQNPGIGNRDSDHEDYRVISFWTVLWTR